MFYRQLRLLRGAYLWELELSWIGSPWEALGAAPAASHKGPNVEFYKHRPLLGGTGLWDLELGWIGRPGGTLGTGPAAYLEDRKRRVL